MENKYNDLDGFSFGETIDINLAKGARIFLLSFGNDEPGVGKFVKVMNSDLKTIVHDLVTLYPHDPDQVKKIIGQMKFIADDVLDIIGALAFSDKNDLTHNNPTDEDKEKEIELFREFIYSDDMFGLFYIGQRTDYGHKMGVGIRGKLKDIAKSMGVWFENRPAHAINFITRVDKILDDFKRNIAFDDKTKNVMENHLKELVEDFRKHMEDDR